MVPNRADQWSSDEPASRPLVSLLPNEPIGEIRLVLPSDGPFLRSVFGYMPQKKIQRDQNGYRISAQGTLRE